LVLFIYAGYPLLNLKHSSNRKIIISFLTGAFIVGLLLNFQALHTNIIRPKVWDFLCFYLNGNVAARGLNFYDAQNYLAVLNELAIPVVPGKSFLIVAVNAAFPYPPPTMLYFLPLGYLSYFSALKLWTGINIFFLFITIIFLWRYFLTERHIAGFLFIASAILLLPATRSNFNFLQTNIFTLLSVTLLWIDRDHWRSGLWLTLGLFTKPYFIIIIMYLILCKQWKGILTLFLSALLISGLTILIFDFSIFSTYFIRGTPPMPIGSYLEWPNQSLLATLLRMTWLVDILNPKLAESMHDSLLFPKVNPLSYIPFIIASIVLAVVTLWAVYKTYKINNEWPLGLMISFSLIIYPATLYHYNTVLILPILAFYFGHNRIYITFRETVLIITVLYLLIYFFPFLAILSTWSLMLYACWVELLKHQKSNIDTILKSKRHLINP